MRDEHGRIRWVRLGGVTAAVCVPAALVLFVLALLTANPCGAFADGCDDYGKTTTAASVLATLGGICFSVGVVAGVGAVVAAVTRRLHRASRARSADGR